VLEIPSGKALIPSAAAPLPEKPAAAVLSFPSSSTKRGPAAHSKKEQRKRADSVSRAITNLLRLAHSNTVKSSCFNPSTSARPLLVSNGAKNVDPSTPTLMDVFQLASWPAHAAESTTQGWRFDRSHDLTGVGIPRKLADPITAGSPL